MKKMFSLLIVFVMTMWSCEKINPEDAFSFYNIGETGNGNNGLVLPEIGKRGIGQSMQRDAWSVRVASLDVHWFYTWGNTVSDLQPEYVDFVPMIWGKNGIDEQKIADLQAMKEEGSLRYLLGFNEPDKTDQSNMTVSEAVEKWPLLEQVGVPLGSPAAANPTGSWMQEFMQKVDENGLRVDFMCVHWYGGVNPQSLLDKLDEVYNLYGKPIWITEFAPADWDAATPGENEHTPGEVLNFMQTVLPELEALDYLHRYAWFSFDQDSPQGTSSALFDASGELTTLGEYYAGFEPNIYLGEGVQPSVGEDVVVFLEDFETGDFGNWDVHADNCLIQSAQTMGNPDHLIDGVYSCYKNWGDGDFISQVIDLEPGAEHTLSFDTFFAWDGIYINAYIYDVSTDELIAEANAILSDPNSSSVDFTAPEGGSVKIVFNKLSTADPGRVGVDNIMIVQKAAAEPADILVEDFETGDLNGWENHADNGMVQSAADIPPENAYQIIDGEYSYFKNWGNGDMISRVIELEAGVEYTLTYETYMAWDWIYINAYIYDAADEELIAETEVHMKDPNIGSVDFKAPEGGSVKLLFNKWADSPGRVGIDNIVISEKVP